MSSTIVKGGSLNRDHISNLLLIQLGDIGDVVLTTPSIAALRRNFPQSKITIAVRFKARELMQDYPLVDEILIGDKLDGNLPMQWSQTINQIRTMRRAKYDLAIDFRTGTRGAIMARSSGAPQRVAFYEKNEAFWRNWVFTHLADIPYQLGTYVADYYHQILCAFDLSNSPGPLKLVVSPAMHARADQVRRRKQIPETLPYIVLQPFSLWSYKELTIDHYVQIIEYIDKRYGIPVVIAGGPADKHKAERIEALCRCRTFNLCGDTTIGEMAALVAQSRLFVGIDSAGIHIAAALERPTVCIFGPSSPDSWAPRGSSHQVVQPDEPCTPCRQKGCKDTEVSLCLQRFPVAKILAAIEHQLGD